MMKSKGFNFMSFSDHKSLQSNNVKGKISINENFGSKNEVSIYEKSKGLILMSYLIQPLNSKQI